MGYRDDFYTAANIIGYTGVLNSRPTVYFYAAAASAYGHITQAHPNRTNIGRETYAQDANYRIENAAINAYNYPVGEIPQHAGMPAVEQACVEWATGSGGAPASFHTSRNLFVPVRPSVFFPNAAVQNVALAVCAIAIREYQNIKPRYA